MILKFTRSHPISTIWGVYALISWILVVHVNRTGLSSTLEFFFAVPLMFSAKPLMPVLKMMGLVNLGVSGYMGSWPTPTGYFLSGLFWFGVLFFSERGIRRIFNSFYTKP